VPPTGIQVLLLLLPQGLVELVERAGVVLREPRLGVGVGHRRGEGRGVGELVEGPVDLVGEDLLLRDGVLDVLGRGDAVEGEVLEQTAEHLLLEVELEGLLPAHHLARQHVVEHLGDQRGDAVPAPEPLVDPGLHDRHVRLVLLEEELDGLEAEGHVPRLVALRREAEGHRRQVTVERGARHERHEQQVGQQVLE
jgi:hypothetical protein